MLVVVSFIQNAFDTSHNSGDRDIVLVTGGGKIHLHKKFKKKIQKKITAGFIGSHTMVQLLLKNRRVVCLDNYVNSRPKSVQRVREIVGNKLAKNLVVYRVDLTSNHELSAVFAKHGAFVSHVIHFAGLKAVAESLERPLEYYRNNLDSTLLLLHFMAKHQIKNLVFSSSGAKLVHLSLSLSLTSCFVSDGLWFASRVACS